MVGTPNVTIRGAIARWSVPVDGPAPMPDSIWYEVPVEYVGMLTDTADPALIALTIPAMRLGVPLIVEGSVTEDLAFSYPDLQALYSASSDRPTVRAEFERTQATRASASAVAAGFSGGVDSYALLADHHYAAAVPDSLRLTHLLFNNVGSHGGLSAQLWRRRYERLEPVARAIGLPLIAVNSNLDRIPAPGVWYEQLNSPANASVAHLLAGGLRTWIFASSVDFRRQSVSSAASNSAFVDPIALPLMSTRALSLRPASSRLRRIDKVRRVADIPDAWTSLDVCVSAELVGPVNCSHCRKCLMTLAALDLIGAEERFCSQFDLEAWRAQRVHYLARVSLTTYPALVRELNELMAETGYRVPRRERWRAAAQMTAEKCGAQARRVVPRAARAYRQLASRRQQALASNDMDLR